MPEKKHLILTGASLIHTCSICINLFRPGGGSESYVTERNNRGDCMLINHLLPALHIEENGKVVKATDAALNLISVNQKYGCRDVILAKLV